MKSTESTQDEKARKRALRVLAGSGASAEQFGEPRGYALKWDGTALPDDPEVAEAGASPQPQDVH
ncbi:MAG: hypothetical protein WCD51_06970 [Anaerolineae bacterium]|jgi:hypothetical protein